MSPRKVNTENQDRRQAIIKAGYAEILEKGIHGTTIDSMVGRANSSKDGAPALQLHSPLFGLVSRC
jgi:AcrR family transcriptional regulator